MSDHDSEMPSPMTFEFVKGRSAGDLRQIATAILKAADDVEAGDLGAFEDMFCCDEGGRLMGMRQIAMIRYGFLQEQLEDARSVA